MNDWWQKWEGWSRNGHMETLLKKRHQQEEYSPPSGEATNEENTPTPAAPVDGYNKSAMIDELRSLNAITEGQFSKLAAEVSRESAEEAAKRLKKLDESAPSPGKVMRGAAVGSLVGPVANMALRAASGSKARLGQPVFQGARPILAQAAHGAIFGGLMPAGQHKLETEVEKKQLKKYISEHPRSSLKKAVSPAE